ncbi:SDR family NAD(P)-dependent oxidoreductase [Yinghuangia sp. YIM S09857]|uniref:SDR family NAD(P)-dependent oxidoreductase n=1 Tax=Yinghuangia sp. YIM S09857 TaxID=3436929 RepID=UPI003F5298CC
MQDKVVVVTGAGNGIGRGCALRLAEEGADGVVVADLSLDRARRVAGEIVEAGGRASAYAADVRDAQACEDMAQHAVDRFGRLDVLVAAAGINGQGASGDEHDGVTAGLTFSSRVWSNILDVNLTGLMQSDRAVARRMIAGGGGAIVNIASMCSAWASAGSTPYNVSKAAAWMLTKSLAIELAPHGIRVNAVGPGFIDETGMTEKTRADDHAFRAATDRILMGRFGRPREVADAVLFLASDESSYFTGSILYPDGGFNAPSR